VPYKKFITGLSLALEKTAVHLSPGEMLALGNLYKAKGPGEVKLTGHPNSKFNSGTTYFTQFYVRWSDFCNDVDSANTVKGLEQTPLGDTVRTLDVGGAPVASGTALTALDKIKGQVKTSGMVVKHFFQDFEANQNSVMAVGHVTRQQFSQCFSRLKLDSLITTAEFQAVCDFYRHRTGVINYRAFVNTVDPPPPSINPWKTNSSITDADAGGVLVPTPAPVTSPTAEVVLRRLQAACKTDGIRIHEFFQDFDRLRSGDITTAQFEKGINIALDRKDCVITPADTAALCCSYASSTPGRVRWFDLCNDIDAVFVTKGLETLPTGAIPSDALAASATALLAPVSTEGELSVAEEDLCADAMAVMRTLLDTCRIQLEPFFKDFAVNQNSPMRVNNVTDVQFSQVLSRLGLQVSESQLAALTKKFRSASAGARGGSGFVNFKVFCDVMQPPPAHINPWKTVG
jgi:hypothetical protein